MTEVVDRTSSSNRVAAETAATTQPVEPAPTVDVAALGELLLGKWAHIRHTARDLAGRPEVHKVEGLTHTEHRKRVFGQLKYLVDNNAVHRAFPTSLGGSDDHEIGRAHV